ncbi:Armadillo type fold [Echinococcus multilocularis]|uniref:Armadillo type fold n=1 Tax=Echinococcus multilocularis TaxID=6211 RepID=A0A068YF27_ECHMU|nr:Armadillo type fold [Echinococcus multilocularis]
MDCSFTQRDGASMEITAHMSSFLTLLQKLLDIEDGQLADECYPLLMLLTEDLPAHILASIKDFLLAAIFHRLDKEAENIRRFVHTASLMLCKRLPTQFIFEFILLQLRCHNSNIRRNSIDVLTTLILTKTIPPLEIEIICGKLVQTLFDDEPKVIRAALECFAAIFSLNYMSENQFIKCLSTITPKPYFSTPSLQKLGKATQSHLISAAAATNSTKRKICPSNLALEDLLRISDPARDAQSNGYAHIAERRRLKDNEILSRDRSLFHESSVLRSISEKKLNGLRRCYSALSLEERDGESHTSFSQENREALTRRCSGYASEDVNQVAGTKPHVEVVLKRYQDENGGESFPQRSTSLMLVSASRKQIRPRLRKPLHARFKRSRTVHWASRALCGPGVDVRGAVDTLTSGEWEKQHDALQILSYFFGANLHTECHELRSWSLEQIQQLCSGLVFAASSLRSQVSRMAIEGIKSTVKLLTSEQLEPVTRSLFFGLVGRVGGDASTAFLRSEACEAINLLAERAPALALLVCLNDACHNTPSRSLLGRRCLVRCYAAVLPRLLTPSACLSKGNQHSLPTRKFQDTFNRMLPHLASFLRNGDFETRNNGEKILQVLMANRDFETHFKSLVSDHDRSTFIEAMDKISKRKSNSCINGSFSTPRMPRRPTLGRSGSRPFDRCTTTSPPPAPLPLTPRSPLPNEVVQCDYYIDGSKVTMLRLGERERLLSLLKLGAQIKESDVPIELSTPEILDLVSPMLRDENEEVVVTALKLCLDARQLDLRNSCCKHYEEKFCPGLLSLLCEREDAEGFTSVLALIYRQLHSKLMAVSDLSRKCLDETRRILGAGALVKPLLQAIHLSTSGTASLVHELCDIMADLDVESPLIARHLLPAAAQLLRRCHSLAEAGWRKCNEVDTAEHDAVATFIKCLANLAGVDALHATTALEGLNDEILQHFLVPD